jgi:hypothetical protein
MHSTVFSAEGRVGGPKGRNVAGLLIKLLNGNDVAGLLRNLLPTKLLMDNNVADVADFPARNANSIKRRSFLFGSKKEIV